MESNSPEPTSERDRAALRITAAAVAAQQAALIEREVQLNEREAALVRHEHQLASHLDDKRRQLEALLEQLGTAREQLRRDREDVARLQTDAEADRREAQERCDRLRALHGRFVRRWKRHWGTERESWQRRHSDLDRDQIRLNEETDRLRRQRESFEQIRRHFHGETELEKRRLQEDWRLLSEAKEHQRRQGQTAEAVFAEKREQLGSQARDLAEAQQRWNAERKSLENLCATLRADAQGLENRLTASRRRLLEQAQSLTPVVMPQLSQQVTRDLPAHLPVLPADVEASFAARDEYQRNRQVALERQTAALADQRLHLVELYERLAQAARDWEARQAESATELEALAEQLHRQDEAVQERRRELESAGDRVRQEREAVQQRRHNVERSLAELNVRLIMWQGERGRFRAEIEEREHRAERRERALTELFARWRGRRTAEVGQMRQLVRENLETRQTWLAQREEWQRRAQALREAQQALAEQAAALEEARQEFLQQTDRPTAAVKRLERLRRRVLGRAAASRRDLEKRRTQLEAEDMRLADAYRQLQAAAHQNVRRERELASAQTEVEERARQAEERIQRLAQLQGTWDKQRQEYEQQLVRLREEIERLAWLLIDGGDAPEVLTTAA